jgi:DMSO/TMAO reductase YedYZ molybdopterin-dependent catalytic subunit
MSAWRRSIIVLGCALAFAILGIHVVAQTKSAQVSSGQSAKSQDAAVLLRVTGEVAHAQQYRAEDLAKLPRQTVRAKSHSGAEGQYEGVALIDLLAKAGVPTDRQLKGQAVALYVVVEAADAYRAVFAVAELDRSFTDRVILLADRRDGQPLTAHEGPLQVVVPGEKKHARWVRHVIQLKVGRG